MSTFAILASAWAHIKHITASSITQNPGYNAEGLESEQSKLEGKLEGSIKVIKQYIFMFTCVYLRFP